MVKISWWPSGKCFRKSISVDGKQKWKYYYFPNTARGKEQAYRAYLADKAELTGANKKATEHCRKQLQRVQRYLEAYDRHNALLPLVADMVANMQLSKNQIELLKVLRLGENILERMSEPLEVIEFIKLLSLSWGTTEYCLPDIWLNRVQLTDDKTQSQTIEFWLEHWKQNSKRPGKLKPYSIRAKQNHIQAFINWVDVKSPIQIIDNNFCRRYEDHLESLPLASETKKNYFRMFSDFCNYLTMQDNLQFTKPAILSSKQIRFRNPKGTGKSREEKKEMMWSPAQFKEAIRCLPLKAKVWVMLCLNCGMRNVDLAQTKWSQLQGDRLKHQRYKLDQRENAPTINYKLWPKTLELINKLPRESEFICMTLKKLPLIDFAAKVKDGECPNDRASKWWGRNRIKYNLNRMDYLRKTGATFVARLDPGLTRMYLAETLTADEEIHYAFLDGEINEKLDLITDKMGEHFNT